jgi:IPT/TIG domain-containing protein
MQSHFKRHNVWPVLCLLAILAGCAASLAPLQAPGQPGNVTVNAKPAQPTIKQLSPTSGAVGATVTITGSGFGSTQGSGAVRFNGTTATASVWSALSITVTVPSGATSGNVTVTTAGGLVSAGSSFTVTTGGSCTFPTCFPDASNTGTTGSLTNQSGNITTSSNGQTIQGINLTNGSIFVEHSNVTIQNVRINPADGIAIFVNVVGVNTNTSTSGLVVQDCILDGSNNTTGASAIGLSNYTLRRCEIIGYGEGPGMGGGVLIEENYMHGFQFFSGAHQDCLQGFSNNIQIIHNTCFHDNMTTANAFLQLEDQPGNFALVEHNLIAVYGNYCFSIGAGFTIRNNRYSTMFFPQCAFFGIYNIVNGNPGPRTVCGNRWYDGPNAGQLVSGESDCGGAMLGPSMLYRALLAMIWKPGSPVTPRVTREGWLARNARRALPAHLAAVVVAR